MQAIRCKECKQVVAESDLRDHWAFEHAEKLQAIDKWLGKVEDRARSWEKWIEETEGRMI